MLSRRVSNPADVSRVFHHDNPVSRDLLSEGPGFEDAAHQYAQREADYQKSDWQEAAKWYQKSADQGFASIVSVQCTLVDMPSSRTTQRLLMVISAATTALQLPYGAMHEKFAASLVLPVPLYFATCGYGHSGRVMITRLFST